MGIKAYNFFRFFGMFLIFYLFLPLYVLAIEVAVVNSHHGISVKCSRYRDTGPTDPSLLVNNMTAGFSCQGQSSFV